MKKTGIITFTALSILLFLGPNFATALEPVPKESGFSGFIRPGAGYINYKSNLVASFLRFDLSEKKINSLTDSPDSQSNFIALVPFTLEYTFASTRTQLFMGTELTDLIRFDLSQQIGVKQGIGKAGILQGGFLFNGIPAKEWKDPYVVDQDRDETSRTATGGRLVWDRIFGVPLQLQYSYRKIDIGSEKSGEFLGLTSAERDLLDRNGDRHIAEAIYRFRFAQKHTFAPQFIYTKDNRDGDARKNDAYDFQLTYAYFGNPFRLTTNAFVGWADYDDKNPIYGKTQNDDRYGIVGTLYYENPWNWSLFGSNPINFFINAGFVKTVANIDFYDQQLLIATGGVFLKW